MLAVTTDMKAPKDLNAVAVSISTNNKVKTSFIGRVTPQGDILLPGTVAIAEPDEKDATVRIRVMAFQNQKPRVIRDVRTTVPTGGRIALLRIPLNFVNDGKVVGDLLSKDLIPSPIPGSEALGPPATPDNTGTSADTSGDLDFALFGYAPKDCLNIDTETIIDGECKDSFIDSSTLPEFDAAQLGDSTGQSGACFSVGQCFATATGLGQSTTTPVADGGTSGGGDASTSAPDGSAGGNDDAGFDAGPKPFKDFRPAAVTFDRATCSLALNGADPARLNIAIVTPETGECVRPGECYIPIDHGATGWQEDASGRVQLPSYLCKLLDAKGLRLATSSDTCAAKTESNPICTPKIGDDAGISTVVDGGADAIAPSTAFSVPEDFAAAVAISGSTLYFASQSRQGFVDLAAPAAKPAPISGIAVAGSAHLPWRFSPAPGGAALVNGSVTGYVLGLQGGSQSITFPKPIVDVAAIDTGFVWSTTQSLQTESFYIAPPLPFQTGETRVADVTATGSIGGQYVLVGDLTGGLRVCQPQFMSCGPVAPAGSARVDGVAFRDGSNGYALTASGLYAVSVNTSINATAVQPIFSDPPAFAGIQEGPLYFAHGVAATGGCVVFSNLNGLFYVTDKGGTFGSPTPLVTPPVGQPILGVAIGPDPSSAGKAAYYTVFAPRDASGGTNGGGVYRVKLPAECTGASSGADAGTPPDSGVVCGPGNCPAGCCQGNACVSGKTDTACGKNGVQCIDCTGFGSTCGAVSQMCN